MKKKLKFISIIALILAITISFSSSCFAVETDNENSKTINIYYNDKSYIVDYSEASSSGSGILADTYNNYIVVNDSGMGIRLYLTYNDNYKVGMINNYYHLYRPDSSYKYISFKYKSSEDKFVYGGVGPCDGSEGTYSVQILSSNYDVLDKKGEVVFQKTPVPAQNQAILVPIVQEAPLEETTKEIMGILPIVLITLVGLIGLRKGLALLLQTLHKA